FVQLAAMFQMAAMQHMGKLPNPVTQEVERDLDQARATIEMLEMIQRKTVGNRTPAEEAWLDKVLFELRMNFVDEVRAAEGERGDETGKADDAGGGAGEAPEGAES
ncbi:MAG: DUF1844 domain-containing protein, partial [Candidatus Krumholzibacteria bacterium]|nr:DUF1844 domain-containing protein [Candidatus Krumholzibacteria bacterium]